MIYSDNVSLIDVAEDSDGVARIIQYVLKGVYLERATGVSIDKDGEKRAYNCTLFVPKSVQSDDTYVEAKAWERLPFSDKLTSYTFRPQQLIVGTDKALTYETLNEVMNEEQIVFQVIGVDYLDKVLPHFEVLGK